MKTIQEIPAQQFIDEMAKDLKENQNMEKPDWANYVKTGIASDTQPEDPNWWYFRASSILRKISIDGPIGVEKLRKKYSSKQNRGRMPEKTQKAGGKIIRTLLIQLDELGLTEKTKKGRGLTPKGQSYINEISKKFA